VIKYRINGKEVTERVWRRRKGVGFKPGQVSLGTVAYSGSKPLESLALSCHPDQVAEYNEAARKEGLTGISWDARGRCSITSRGDRKAWLRVQGLHDNEGGYGD
jgi:hypothetical protein